MQIFRYKEASGAQCAVSRRLWVPDKSPIMSAVDTAMPRWCLITTWAPNQRCAATPPFHSLKHWGASGGVSPSPCAGGGCRKVIPGCTCPWTPILQHERGVFEPRVFLHTQNSPQAAGPCKTHSLFKETMLLFRCTKALEERSLIWSDGFFMTSLFPKTQCHCHFPLCSDSCHSMWVCPFGPFPHFLPSSPLSLPFIFYFLMFLPEVLVLL